VSEVFISYARSSEADAQRIAEFLRNAGFSVWRDDALPVHRAYAEVIEEQLRAAKAVIVLWCVDAAKSQWVRAEADVAREAGTLVQLTLDGTLPPLPFNQVQCGDLRNWSGDVRSPVWMKVVGGIRSLIAGEPAAPSSDDSNLSEHQSKPSIAVLPLANLSNDPEQDYFADGMVVEIVALLSRFKSLFVIASGSSLALKGQALSPSQAARKLGVRYVLEGSVRKAGGQVRIVVQLVDSGDGALVWTHRFDESLVDVFALQDRVALSVAGVIEPAIRDADVRRAVQRPTGNMGSYDLYLRALALLRMYEWSRMGETIDLIERAIALDPNHAAAVALAVRCHYIAALYAWSGDPEDHRRRAQQLADIALRIANDDASALSTVAAILGYLGHDLRMVVGLVERALSLNPGSATAWFNSGIVRVMSNDLSLGIEQLETAARLDPIGPDRPGRMLFIAMAYFQQRRFDDAIRLSVELFQHFNNPTASAVLAASYGHLGQLDEGRAAIKRFQTLSPLTMETLAPLIWRHEQHLELFHDGIARLKIEPTPVNVAGA
jgi:adenylate cyclase